MNKKCSKYEGLFVFSDKNSLEKHLKECPDCYAEHEKMQKVSELLKEVKFYYNFQARHRKKLKAVCASALFLFFSTTFGIIQNNTELLDVLLYGESLTAEDLGFPVDSYGLLMVDDEI